MTTTSTKRRKHEPIRIWQPRWLRCFHWESLRVLQSDQHTDHCRGQTHTHETHIKPELLKTHINIKYIQLKRLKQYWRAVLFFKSSVKPAVEQTWECHHRGLAWPEHQTGSGPAPSEREKHTDAWRNSDASRGYLSSCPHSFRSIITYLQRLR